ncbi:trypco2 family protein (plasmid) [Streptomyces sp. HUAS TT3]|uniref:trypco2 family protein n=1 Tax=Streptomyces sp. HUAS TT3 TaxID=3447510 RepID=UPI003F6604C9
MDIELADAVEVIRNELLAASARGAGSGVKFLVGPIEMEFALELRADATARAGFKAWVVSAEAGGGVARTSTQRVKFSVTPQSSGGGDLLISGSAERPRGAGRVEGYVEP